jgi:hypothetical protein
MFYSLVNGKVTLTGPVFVKDYEKDNDQTRYLEDLYARVQSRKRNLVKRDLILLRQGLAGEANVYFELKNSFLPMLILHDIRLEHEGYTAQYDFILITKQGIFVLETKKLNGDIEINADGDFVRSFRNGYGKLLKKEGMYSPVSQNQRHVKILKEMLVANKLIRRMPVHSYVVLANPKTILNKRHAPKEIQSNIVRYDQLSEVLRKQMSQAEKDMNLLEKLLYPIAEFLQANHKPVTYDLVERYSISDLDFGMDPMDSDLRDDELEALEAEAGIDLKVSPDIPLHAASPPDPVRMAPLVTPAPPLSTPDTHPEVAEAAKTSPTATGEDPERSRIHDDLRTYRLYVSKAEGIKAYMVFTNEVLDELVERRPQTPEELLMIKGMGAVKVAKYGPGILPLLHE